MRSSSTSAFCTIDSESCTEIESGPQNTCTRYFPLTRTIPILPNLQGRLRGISCAGVPGRAGLQRPLIQSTKEPGYLQMISIVSTFIGKERTLVLHLLAIDLHMHKERDANIMGFCGLCRGLDVQGVQELE